MALKNTLSQYGSVAKCLHWAIGILILLMLLLGYCMDDFGSAMIFNLHKMTGLSILLLVIFRVIWALMNRRPALPQHMKIREKYLAYGVQGLLYVCMLAMPLSGWAMASASGHYPHLGSMTLPMPGIPNNSSLAEVCFEIHSTTAIILITLIILHVLGALKHRFIDKDDVLQTML